MKITVLQGQSLLDIAVQACGSVEAAFGIAAMNGLSVTDDLQAGQQLEVPEPAAKQIASYYTTRNLKPATQTDLSDDIGRVFFDEMPVEFE